MSAAKYLGPCFEYFTNADGSIELKKLYLYRGKDGERRFALTEQAAREAVG